MYASRSIHAPRAASEHILRSGALSQSPGKNFIQGILPAMRSRPKETPPASWTDRRRGEGGKVTGGECVHRVVLVGSQSTGILARAGGLVKGFFHYGK
jgi:hypothetical protein